MWTSLSLLTAMGASLTSARHYDISANFTLRLDCKDDPSIDGNFLSSLHVGAATEVLSPSSLGVPNGFNTFTFHSVTDDDKSEQKFDVGFLAWVIFSGGDPSTWWPQPLRFDPNL